MSRGTIEIPIEVWEGCERDAERIAFLHKQVASLANENERLKELVESNLNIGKKVLGQSDALRIERDSLAAENERLRKAGDAMAKWFNDGGFYGFGFQETWLAAKEGRDVK